MPDRWETQRAERAYRQRRGVFCCTAVRASALRSARHHGMSQGDALRTARASITVRYPQLRNAWAW